MDQGRCSRLVGSSLSQCPSIYRRGSLYTDCAQVAQDILDGKYGKYQVADRWDAAFDWDNDACDEVIFGFPGAPGL